MANALNRIGIESVIVRDPDELAAAAASGLILPGVGSFDDAIRELRRSALAEAIADWIAADRLFLGICLGMQMLFDGSEEGQEAGLAVLPGRVRSLPRDRGVNVPHMGWNDLVDVQDPMLQTGR